MPWSLGDALRHTKKATTKKSKSAWSATANSVLSRSGDEGKAVRIANSVVAKSKRSHKKKV